MQMTAQLLLLNTFQVYAFVQVIILTILALLGEKYTYCIIIIIINWIMCYRRRQLGRLGDPSASALSGGPA
jgi:hypothetical protein